MTLGPVRVMATGVVVMSCVVEVCSVCHQIWKTYHLATHKQNTIQLNLNLTNQECSMYSTWHISHVYVHACASKVGDIEALMQSTHVHTRHV